jgi:hypothetical protein
MKQKIKKKDNSSAPKPEIEKEKVGKAAAAQLVDFEIKGNVGYNQEQKYALVGVLTLQRSILNSQEFKMRFINLKCRQKVLNGKQMSMKEIYDLLLSGKNRLDESEDHDLDYFHTLYDGGSKGTLGYTSMSTGRIYTNRKVFDSWIKSENFSSMCSHLFHEYLHSMGFKHKWDWGKKRQSMVYRAGYLMRDMAKLVLEDRINLTPIHPKN